MTVFSSSYTCYWPCGDRYRNRSDLIEPLAEMKNCRKMLWRAERAGRMVVLIISAKKPEMTDRNRSLTRRAEAGERRWTGRSTSSSVMTTLFIRGSPPILTGAAASMQPGGVRNISVDGNRLQVVYLETGHSRSSAAGREAVIKAMNRADKLDLISRQALLLKTCSR